MVISDLENPDSTGYTFLSRTVIRYVNTYNLTIGSVIIKKDLPKYPQARKNKRDNFILK